MTDIMKLAEAFAYACADVREFLGANAGMNEADGTWIASQQARTALQSAISSMKAENEQLKREIENQYRCIKSHAQVTQKAEAERDTMREAHRKLIRAYVNLLESGRDRIISLGGTCDPVDQMEAGDPALREAKEALTAANAVSEPQYSIDADPQGIRARVVSAVVGAMAYGASNTNKPPEGHWLNEVWDIALAEANRVQPQAQGEAVAWAWRFHQEPWQVGTEAPWFSERSGYEKRPLVFAAHPQATEPAPKRITVTDDMHRAAVKVLHRAPGLDGLPQRMMDAMLAAAPKQPTNTVQE